MNTLISCVILLTLGSLAYGQTFRLGGCPKVPLQSTFNVTRYLGKWYEIDAFANWFEGDRCGTAEYALKEDGTINVDNRYRDGDLKEHGAVGEARQQDAEHEPAQLEVRFSKFSPWGDYDVIDTDYEGHSVVFSCRSLGLFHIELSWILARKPFPDSAMIDGLKKKLSGYGVDVSHFRPSNHTGCPQ